MNGIREMIREVLAGRRRTAALERENKKLQARIAELALAKVGLRADLSRANNDTCALAKRYDDIKYRYELLLGGNQARPTEDAHDLYGRQLEYAYEQIRRENDRLRAENDKLRAEKFWKEREESERRKSSDEVPSE